MREISPAVGMSVNEWLAHAPELKPLVEGIRHQKESGKRLMPSASLIDKSSILTATQRALLLDQVAALADENYCGRSEMCLQFSVLMQKALTKLGFAAKVAVGSASYFDDKGKKLYTWEHAWVRVGSEVIDGNVDSLAENPAVPETVRVSPYWGSITDTPRDRQLKENLGAGSVPPDEDVDGHW
jgi:hypothetical protein